MKEAELQERKAKVVRVLAGHSSSTVFPKPTQDHIKVVVLSQDDLYKEVSSHRRAVRTALTSLKNEGIVRIKERTDNTPSGTVHHPSLYYLDLGSNCRHLAIPQKDRRNQASRQYS